jgi:AcrR family transcriptional regulator
MRDICREARVTAPTVYYYFKSKEILFETVVRETITMAEFTKMLSAEIKKATDHETQISAFTRVYLSSFPNKLINTGLYLRRSTQLDPVGAQKLLREFSGVELLLVRIIRDGVSARKFRETDPQMAAECLLGMMNRFIFQRIHFQRVYKASEAASYLTDFFLRGMKARSQT